MSNNKIATIILAAGQGTRMRSELAKVLHPVSDRPMVFYPIELARSAGSAIIALVVGHQADVIREKFAAADMVFVHQEEQLGTGHAVLQARDVFKNFQGNVLILCGDVPLLLSATVKALIASHVASDAAVTVLTTCLDDPAGYGRVVKGSGNAVLKIVEDRDATDDEKKIKEINSGIYCVEKTFLFEAVEQIRNTNAQGEYYLTDILDIAGTMHCNTNSLMVNDFLEVMGINTPEDLAKANRIMDERLAGIETR